MAQRILLKTGLQIRSEYESVTYNVNVTSNLITLQISHEIPDDNLPSIDLINCTLSLETLKSMKRLKPNTLVALAIPSVKWRYQQVGDVISVDSTMLKDASKLSHTIRSNNPGSAFVSPVPAYLYIFVKDTVNGTFNDYDIIVVGPSKEFTFNSNETFTDGILDTEYDHVDLVDTITATEDTQYSNEDYYKFNVSTASYNEEIYVEPVVGITDRTRIKLTNGNGSFRVLKSSLLSNDTMRVKLGFYSYSGLTEVTKTV
jgi:hypothetical protein